MYVSSKVVEEHLSHSPFPACEFDFAVRHCLWAEHCWAIKRASLLPFITAILQLLWVHFYTYKGDVIGHYTSIADSFYSTMRCHSKCSSRYAISMVTGNAGPFFYTGNTVILLICAGSSVQAIVVLNLISGEYKWLNKSNFVHWSPKNLLLMKVGYGTSSEQEVTHISLSVKMDSENVTVHLCTAMPEMVFFK